MTMTFVVLALFFFTFAEILSGAGGNGFPTNSNTVNASRVCKPGPSLRSMSIASKKCLVIGDSVSIGYTEWLSSVLEDVCEVYHSPWDTQDGGALDTKYAVICLQNFLKTNLLEEVHYDVIVFNFGLHDANFDYNFPEEYTDFSTYKENLLIIKKALLATESKVGYVLTTPIPFNTSSNERVKTFNAIAREVMSNGETLAIADLYKWVVLVCGEPPYKTCEIADKQPSPHYTPRGYRYLSVLVSDLILKLLLEESRVLDHHTSWINNIITEPHHNNKNFFPDSNLPCMNKTGQIVTKCPDNMTCSPSRFTVTGVGCCPLTDAVSCTDGKHCCPAGYKCDSSCTLNRCLCNRVELVL